ncbi:endonuclease, partial [Streptococcus suis]
HIGYDKYEEGSSYLTKLPGYELDPYYCSKNKSFDSILSRKIMVLTVFYIDKLIDLYSCHIIITGSEDEDHLDNVRTIV